MLSFTSYRYIKALSVVFGLAALILSFQLRSFLGSHGEFEASTSMVALYSDYYMATIMLMHFVAAIFFFSQMASRIKLDGDRLSMMGIETSLDGSMREKMKIIWSGVSVPILISLMFWSWITFVQVPEALLTSDEATMLYHLLFLVQAFYVTWGFSNYDMKLLDYHYEEHNHATREASDD